MVFVLSLIFKRYRNIWGSLPLQLGKLSLMLNRTHLSKQVMDYREVFPLTDGESGFSPRRGTVAIVTSYPWWIRQSAFLLEFHDRHTSCLLTYPTLASRNTRASDGACRVRLLSTTPRTGSKICGEVFPTHHTLPGSLDEKRDEERQQLMISKQWHLEHFC